MKGNIFFGKEFFVEFIKKIDLSIDTIIECKGIYMHFEWADVRLEI